MRRRGHIQNYDGETLTIYAPYSQGYDLARKHITECEVRLDDGRSISADQRKKIYATLRDISLYTGYTPDEVKAIMKYEYIANHGCPYFSLSDTDMTTARLFLEYLIEFCLEHSIACTESLIERAPDIVRYIYACLVNKKCCICGQENPELHHVDVVGMGSNRNEITHIGMRALPLCRIHHTEYHTIGRTAFEKKYHITGGIKINDELCGIYKL